MATRDHIQARQLRAIKVQLRPLAKGQPVALTLPYPFNEGGAFSDLDEIHWFGFGIFTVLLIYDRRELIAEDLAAEQRERAYYWLGIFFLAVFCPWLASIGLVPFIGYPAALACFVGSSATLLACALYCKTRPYNRPPITP